MAEVLTPLEDATALANDAPARTPWAHVHAMRDKLEVSLQTIADGRQNSPIALDEVRAASTLLQRLCLLESDAMLSVPLRLTGGRYGVRHSLSSAILLEFMLTRMGTSPSERRTAINAALTMNLGMHELQEQLYAQAGALSPEQRAAVLDHPNVSVALLRGAGLEDRMWIALVTQHHEHLDGTGYPRKLSGDQLWPAAQALMLADRWCAMITERHYRAGAPPDQALQLIVGRASGVADASIGKALSDVLGPYPPGTPVRLVNGEVGVVCRRTYDPSAPVVRVMHPTYGPNGPDGVNRLCIESKLRIEACIPAGELGFPIDTEQLWPATGPL